MKAFITFLLLLYTSTSKTYECEVCYSKNGTQIIDENMLHFEKDMDYYGVKGIHYTSLAIIIFYAVKAILYWVFYRQNYFMDEYEESIFSYMAKDNYYYSLIYYNLIAYLPFFQYYLKELIFKWLNNYDEQKAKTIMTFTIFPVNFISYLSFSFIIFHLSGQEFFVVRTYEKKGEIMRQNLKIGIYVSFVETFIGTVIALNLHQINLARFTGSLILFCSLIVYGVWHMKHSTKNGIVLVQTQKNVNIQQMIINKNVSYLPNEKIIEI